MATNQQEGNEPVIDIIAKDDGSTPAIRVRGESTSGGSLLELRQVGAGAALKLKGDIHLDGDLLDGSGQSGTHVPALVADASAYGNGVTDASAHLQAKIDAARDAGGGVVYLPAGTYLCNTALSVGSAHDNISLVGAGRSVTRIKKNADINLLDVIGDHAATTTTNAVRRLNVRDLTFDGGNNTGWTKPLLRSYYANSCTFDRVDFVSNYGEAIKGVEFWDSYFYGCRFDSVGGTSGDKPAIRAWGGSADGIASGIGHSADNCNNLWFVNCVFETFRDGGIWFTGTGGGALSVNKCNLVNVKLESTALRGPFLKLERCNFMGLVNINCTAGNFGSGYSTPTDLIAITNSNGIDLHHYIGECTETASATVRSFLSVAGGNNQCRFEDLWFSTATVNKPTVAAIEFTGTNDDQSLGVYAYFYNPGSATLLSGSATSTVVQGPMRASAANPLQLYGTAEQQIEFRRTDLTDQPRYLLGRIDTTNKRFRLLYADASTSEFVLWDTDSTGLFRAANGISVADAKDIALGTTTGTKIGTATTQKLGFFNATPVVQPAANADTSGADLATLEAEVNQLKALLRSLGLMAT